MPVAPHLARWLLPYAGATARDVLFRTIDQYPETDHAPSTELVKARWSEMNAQSAINLAQATDDPVLLDFIASKDKRKTVRLAVAGNTRLHPVTRLYFFQEARRSDDHDLLRSVIKSMSPEEILSYFVNDESLQMRIGQRPLTHALLSSSDTELVSLALQTLEQDASVFHNMLSVDTDKALALFDTHGIELNSLTIRRWPASADASPASVRKILDVVSPDRSGSLVEDFLSSRSITHEYIASIDMALYDTYIGLISRVEVEDVNAAVTCGFARKLFVAVEKGARVANDAAALMALHVSSDAERVTLAFACTDDAVSASLVTNPALFTEASAAMNSESYLRFVCRVAPFLHADVVYALMNGQTRHTVNSSRAASIAMLLGVHVNDLLERLPIETVYTLEHLPEGCDARRYLDWVSAANEDRGLIAATLILKERDCSDALQQRAFGMLLAKPDHPGVAQWILDGHDELVKPFLITHRATLVEIFQKYGNKPHRVSWLPLVIDQLTPIGGWSTLLQGHVMVEAAMVHLTRRIGDDQATWEIVLSLLQDWTGTLDDLMDSAVAL
jgi:hypothetical protein